jgi:hypothetical protein
MSFKDLPRDVQLTVIQKFDIDTRVKTKIIHKLKIPCEFSIKLNSLNMQRRLSYVLQIGRAHV